MKLKSLLLPASLSLLMFAASACKTTEANYRAAYETAVGAERQKSAVDSTIYSRIRNSARMSDMVVGSDTLSIRTEHIGFTDDGGASRESVKRYCIVVGQFKQLFNARQMRKRLQANGYDDAFIIHTREPLYYVCSATCSSPEEAKDAIRRVEADKSLVLRDPLPFVLRPAHIAP